MHGWLSAAGFLTAWVLAHAQGYFTVCVVIPEEDRCIVPRPVLDVACEMAIIRGSFSTPVVGQTQVKFLRMTDVSLSPRLWRNRSEGSPVQEGWSNLSKEVEWRDCRGWICGGNF